jgi:serine/threonine protein kinase
MPPTTRYCPKYAFPLTVPHPPPEKMACPKCAAVLKFAHANAAVGGTGSGDRHAVASPSGSVKAAPAKTVAGHTIQRELSRGGLGVIYLAYHPHFADFRAIKRPLESDGVEREVLLARFRREMQAVGGMRSNNVVRAYDAGEDAEGPYVVTEYLDGESFSSLASRLCMLPIAEACELIRQAALGLQAAHARGLVHRDIKPSNLMLARDQTSGARVVVIDWGLVKMAGEAPGARLTQLHTEMGTLDYISPEQIRDAHSVDIRADIYSLGATLYCLLAGQPPFAGRTDDQKRQAQVQEKFPRLDQVRPSVPRSVLDILEKMVKKNPAERYQTPAEVANALQPFCCAGPHLLLALLAPARTPVRSPHTAAETPPLQMKDILSAETILTPPAVASISQRSYPNQPAPTPAQPISTAPTASTKRPGRGLRIAGLLLVGLCFLACAGVAGLVLYEEVGKVKDTTASTKGKPKQPPPPTGPRLPGGEPGPMKAMSAPAGFVAPSEIAFMPDGRTAITRYASWICMYDLSDYVQRPTPWQVGSPNSGLIVVSPDAKRIVAATDNFVALWNGKTYNKDGPPISLVGDCTAIAFSPDSKILATAERITNK